MNLTQFWQAAIEFLQAYPQRLATLRGDSVQKQQMNRLRQLVDEWLSTNSESQYWKIDASIGIGN